jgi:hypothetical protein
MPVLYKLDAANGIIRTKCVGDVTLEEVLGHFEELARDPDCPSRLDVLLDLTEETTIPQIHELRAVTRAIAKVRERVRFCAVAVVATRDALFGMLRMFQVFTEALFREAQIFRTLEEAEAWLQSQRGIGKPSVPGKTSTSGGRG